MYYCLHSKASIPRQTVAASINHQPVNFYQSLRLKTFSPGDLGGKLGGEEKSSKTPGSLPAYSKNPKQISFARMSLDASQIEHEILWYKCHGLIENNKMLITKLTLARFRCCCCRVSHEFVYVALADTTRQRQPESWRGCWAGRRSPLFQNRQANQPRRGWARSFE